MSSHLAYLVLGTNLGDRTTNLSNAKSEINSLSKNRSLEANSALIVNNALLAGKIASKFSLV